MVSFPRSHMSEPRTLYSFEMLVDAQRTFCRTSILRRSCRNGVQRVVSAFRQCSHMHSMQAMSYGKTGVKSHGPRISTNHARRCNFVIHSAVCWTPVTTGGGINSAQQQLLKSLIDHTKRRFGVLAGIKDVSSRFYLCSSSQRFGPPLLRVCEL